MSINKPRARDSHIMNKPALTKKTHLLPALISPPTPSPSNPQKKILVSTGVEPATLAYTV